MKQCRVPYEDPHGVWTCTGSHYGHTHMDANAPDKLPDRAEGDADRAEEDTENSESSERRRREDDSDDAGNKDEGFESLDESEINALGNAGLPGYSSYRPGFERLSLSLTCGHAIFFTLIFFNT